MVSIIDYSVGNIMAVVNMVNRLGFPGKIVSNHSQLSNTTHIILPGNGAFDSCIKNLRSTGLIPYLNEMVIEKKVPVLGICIGAQMMGNSSEEGFENGLGWINMETKRFPIETGVKTPHMGWNKVEVVNSSEKMYCNNNSDCKFYFVHSYFMKPHNPADTIMLTHHGISFASAVRSENIIGVQFHPEKSHRYGKSFLFNFLKS